MRSRLESAKPLKTHRVNLIKPAQRGPRNQIDQINQDSPLIGPINRPESAEQDPPLIGPISRPESTDHVVPEPHPIQTTNPHLDNVSLAGRVIRATLAVIGGATTVAAVSLIAVIGAANVGTVVVVLLALMCLD